MPPERKPASAWRAGGAVATAVLALALREGFQPAAYKPIPGDEVTIGYGTTRHADGTPIKTGETITRAGAQTLLTVDSDKFAKGIAECIGDVPLARYEFESYLSMTYNVGVKAFCGSSVVRKLHQTPPDYAGSCKAMLLWTKAGGKTIAGLLNRRMSEYRQCMGQGA